MRVRLTNNNPSVSIYIHKLGGGGWVLDADGGQAEMEVTDVDQSKIPQGALYFLRADYLGPDGNPITPALNIPGADFTFQNYDDLISPTVSYPKIKLIIDDGEPMEAPWLYPLLGLMGEAGEVCEKFKKMVRDRSGSMDSVWAVEMQKEVGDVIWYINQLAKSLKTTFADIARQNIAKLISRLERGVLKGSGDNR